MTKHDKQIQINVERQTMEALRERLKNAITLFSADTDNLTDFDKTQALIKENREALSLLEKHSQFYLDALNLEVDED
jgi:hypothetical protein